MDYTEWLSDIDPSNRMPKINDEKFRFSLFDSRDQLFVACFCVQNMIDPFEFWEIIRVINPNCTSSNRTAFLNIYHYLCRNVSRWCKYYAYDCISSSVLDLNKHERHEGVYELAEGEIPLASMIQENTAKPIIQVPLRFADWVDQCGPEQVVPTLIKDKIYNSPLNYRDRCFFASFCIQNSYEPLSFWNMMSIINSHCTEERRHEFLNCHAYISSKESKHCYYYAYDMCKGRVLDLRKHIRHSEE